MTNNVKSFSVGYNPINENNTFTSGDCITGQITLELLNTCKINSLSVKLKGKAEVKWTEHYGRTTVTYHNKEKYFSIKQYIIQEGQGTNCVHQGCHVYPFTFQIPAKNLPPSFKDSYGKIEYKLEANLSRSMSISSKAKAAFTLMHDGKSDSSLMSPQYNTVEKKMKLFTSGAVSMDVNIDRTGVHQGEGVKVETSIFNKSSREIKPKYCLYRKYSYFSKMKRKVQTKDILKEVGDIIPPSTSHTVSRIITIPPTTTPSILTCNLIKAEYRLRVYLDVKYASDPAIKFPIVVLPASHSPEWNHPSALPAYGFGDFPTSYLPAGTNFLQNPTAPGSSYSPPPYETYGMYPSFPDGKS